MLSVFVSSEISPDAKSARKMGLSVNMTHVEPKWSLSMTVLCVLRHVLSLFEDTLQ